MKRIPDGWVKLGAAIVNGGRAANDVAAQAMEGLRMMKLGMLLMMWVSMSADAGLFGHTKSWKEEVQLHDGRVLVIERFYNLGNYPTIDARERALLDETITFTLPESNNKIFWKTEFRQDLPEPNSLGALLLDVVGGVPYLATSPAGCIAYNKWGRPNPPYISFKYVDSVWQQIPLKEFPPELVEANLMNMPALSLLKPYYTVAESKVQRQDGNIAAYAKTILREAVKGGDAITSCQEMVYYKGAWVGPGDSIGKRMMDRRSK